MQLQDLREPGIPDSGKEEGSVRDETSPAPSQRAAPVRPDRADNHVITDGKDRPAVRNP